MLFFFLLLNVLYGMQSFNASVAPSARDNCYHTAEF